MKSGKGGRDLFYFVSICGVGVPKEDISRLTKLK